MPTYTQIIWADVETYNPLLARWHISLEDQRLTMYIILCAPSVSIMLYSKVCQLFSSSKNRTTYPEAHLDQEQP